jgi:hypothetical protein
MARDTIFISYSHADRKYLDRFKVHLAPLEAQGALDVWEDTRIDAGGSWQEDIRRALDRAKAGVLQISPSFLASSFIRGHELPRSDGRGLQRSL